MSPSALLKKAFHLAPGITRPLLQAYLRRWPVPRRIGWIIEDLKRDLPKPERTAARAGAGIRLRIDTRSAIGREIFWLGSYEPTTARLLSRLLRPGMTFLDVGANLGEFSVRAALLVGGEGRVHAFEASPDTYDHLVANIRLNHLERAVVPRLLAVSRERGRREFFLSRGPDSGSSSLYAAHDYTGKAVSVETVDLDGYCAEAGIARVDLLKLDIEGAELEALQGAERLLSGPAAPILIVEYHEIVAERCGVPLAEITRYLEGLRYTLRRLGPLGLGPMGRQPDDATISYNVVALPPRS